MEIIDGFSALFGSQQTVVLAILGTLIRLIGGAVPGLSSGAMIAILNPVTYYLDPLAALSCVMFEDCVLMVHLILGP